MQFYDLHVCLGKSKDVPLVNKFLTVALELGCTGLAIETLIQFPPSVSENFHLFRRTTLSLSSASRLKALTKQKRNLTDLLVIQGRTKPICLAAAANSTVDMVMLSDINDFAAVDSLVARTLAKQNKPVEICLSGLIQTYGSERSKLMRSMAIAVEYLIRAKCNLVITTGAKSPLELRAPRDLIALAYLANIPEDVAKNGVYTTPGELAVNILQSRC